MSLFGPVVMVPTQEPAGKGGRFQSLFDNDGGGARISVGWVTLEVADSWDRRTRSRFRASADPGQPQVTLPVAAASTFSSSAAEVPIQTKTLRKTASITKRQEEEMKLPW